MGLQLFDTSFTWVHRSVFQPVQRKRCKRGFFLEESPLTNWRYIVVQQHKGTPCGNVCSTELYIVVGRRLQSTRKKASRRIRNVAYGFEHLAKHDLLWKLLRVSCAINSILKNFKSRTRLSPHVYEKWRALPEEFNCFNQLVNWKSVCSFSRCLFYLFSINLLAIDFKSIVSDRVLVSIVISVNLRRK